MHLVVLGVHYSIFRIPDFETIVLSRCRGFRGAYPFSMSSTNMGTFSDQTEYWDRCAREKEFTHPFDFERFSRIVHSRARILDYGCGYGRICHQLREAGYRKVIGVDPALSMIREGKRRFPGLDLRHVKSHDFPFPAASFDAVLLFAVLNCIPSDEEQQILMETVHRMLCRGGILYLSDYFLQTDQRNRERYAKFEPEFGTYGVFELPDGAVLRHHARSWIEQLLSTFHTISLEEMLAPTMHGHESVIFQYFGKTT